MLIGLAIYLRMDCQSRVVDSFHSALEKIQHSSQSESFKCQLDAGSHSAAVRAQVSVCRSTQGKPRLTALKERTGSVDSIDIAI